MKTAEEFLEENLSHSDEYLIKTLTPLLEEYASQQREVTEGEVEKIIRKYEDFRSEESGQTIDWDENDAYLSIAAKKVFASLSSIATTSPVIDNGARKVGLSPSRETAMIEVDGEMKMYYSTEAVQEMVAKQKGE